MKACISLVLSLLPLALSGQLWVDTTYTIQTESDLFYGTAHGFAGATDSLFLDLSYPTDDEVPACGRPLLVMVHGGAWIAGDKAEGIPRRIREDFAKRGYTTASVSYRLGQIHTNQFINCNVPLWNCYNMTDSSEWYRAYYRGIQDVNGALRYLINRSEDYEIDPNNVFIVGESAGGFIAMGVGFLDQESEILADLIAELPEALAPNQLYESPCIQTLGLASNIAEMNLTRPALGSYEGTLNLPLNEPYHIRAVGNLYGGVFNNIFTTNAAHPPALYLYHQVCDLIVPYRSARVLSGYVNCLLGFPTNCGYIVNRPIVHGSLGIKQMIDTLLVSGLPTSTYLFDNATVNYNCLQQASNPSFSCHAVDNYWLRTTNMATYFAQQVDTCAVATTITNEDPSVDLVHIYPNPADHTLTIEFKEAPPSVSFVVTNTLGRSQLRQMEHNCKTITLNVEDWQPGVYYLSISIRNQRFSRKVVVSPSH